MIPGIIGTIVDLGSLTFIFIKSDSITIKIVWLIIACIISGIIWYVEKKNGCKAKVKQDPLVDITTNEITELIIKDKACFHNDAIVSIFNKRNHLVAIGHVIHDDITKTNEVSIIHVIDTDSFNTILNPKFRKKFYVTPIVRYRDMKEIFES